MKRFPPFLAALALVAAAGCSKMGNHEQTSEVFRETSVVREGTVAEVEENRLLFWDYDNPASQPVALTIDEETTFVEEGDFVDRGSIEEGQAVRVFFDESAESPEALRIEILSGEEAEQVKERQKSN